MKATLHRLGAIAAALLLTACAHKPLPADCEGCTSVYVEDGQLAVAHLVSADPSAVQRVAASYCQDHQLGKPLIKQPPDLSKYPKWAIYFFQCESQQADLAAAKGQPRLPVAQPSPIPPPAGDKAERFGATCGGMGFQKGTPEYDNCVSKLIEMSGQAEQLREQQRKQAIRMIEQGLSGLTPPTASPTPTTIRLPGGETLTCTQTGSQVSCN
jgi:hypothetical protein